MFEHAQDFINESKRIEGIKEPATDAEITEFNRFMELEILTVAELARFALVFEDRARLGDREGWNVTVGTHTPPPGGPGVRHTLKMLLTVTSVLGPFLMHKAFEDLHPFTDCNGRLGRMIWIWQMKEAPLGFLHTFYYQALSEDRPNSTIRPMYSLENED